MQDREKPEKTLPLAYRTRTSEGTKISAPSSILCEGINCSLRRLKLSPHPSRKRFSAAVSVKNSPVSGEKTASGDFLGKVPLI